MKAMDAVDIPLGARVRLAHGIVQQLADQCGAQILHIKGPALHPTLREPTDGVRASTDADILVRPAHVGRLVRTLTAHGWETVTDFTTGSAFEHAANLWHH